MPFVSLSSKEIRNAHREKECTHPFPLLPIGVKTVSNVDIKIHQAESDASTCRVTVSLKRERVSATKAHDVHHADRTNGIEIKFAKNYIQQSSCELGIPDGADFQFRSLE